MTVALAPPSTVPSIRPASVLTRWERALLQLVVVSWVYAIYEELRAAATGTIASGMAHARQLVSVEHATGLNIEHALQAATLQAPWLAGVANVCYTATHLIAPPIVLVILYRKAPARYRQWRDVFLVMLALALLAFLVYPVLPPRLVPGPQHVTDTSRSYFNVDRVPGAGIVAAPTRSSTPDWAPFMNPMAAMPSLHVGWAVWASLALWSVTRRRWLRGLLVMYPLLMIWSVLVTGNHWLLDAVGGVLVVIAASFVTRMISRARPHDTRADGQPMGSDKTLTTA